MIRGQRVADREAGVVADHGEPLVAERVHQRDQVVGEGAGVVPVRGLVGQPDAALVDRDDLKSWASAGISRRQAYQVSGQPCTSSSGGPSPPMTACRRTSPASMYWLVNVSVNPAGRFGAPETEPGAFRGQIGGQ